MFDADFKCIHHLVDPAQFFDLASDPDEMQNSAEVPAYSHSTLLITELMSAMWDLERFAAEVRKLQARLNIVSAALCQWH